MLTIYGGKATSSAPVPLSVQDHDLRSNLPPEMTGSVPPPSLSSPQHGSRKRPAPEDGIDSGKASFTKRRYASTPDSTRSRRSMQPQTITPMQPAKLSHDIFTFAAQSFFTTFAGTSDQLLETLSFDDDQNEFPLYTNDIEHGKTLYLPIHRPSTGCWCLGVLSVSDDDVSFHYYDPSNDTDRHSVILSWAENWNSRLPHPDNESRALKFTTLVHVGFPSLYDVLR